MNDNDTNATNPLQAPDSGHVTRDSDRPTTQGQPTAQAMTRKCTPRDAAPADTHVERWESVAIYMRWCTCAQYNGAAVDTTRAGGWEYGATYVRASALVQDSLEAQTEACLRYAETAHISVPAQWRFVEKASRLLVARTEYQKMMDRACWGLIKHIIVFCPDRLGRDAAAFAFIPNVPILEHLGVRVHTHLDENPREVVGIMNEHDSRIRSKRSRTCRN